MYILIWEYVDVCIIIFNKKTYIWFEKYNIEYVCTQYIWFEEYCMSTGMNGNKQKGLDKRALDIKHRTKLWWTATNNNVDGIVMDSNYDEQW